MGFRCFRGILEVWRAFFGVEEGVLRRGKKGDEGDEADSLRKAAKRWERKCLEKGVAGFMTER